MISRKSEPTGKLYAFRRTRFIYFQNSEIFVKIKKRHVHFLFKFNDPAFLLPTLYSSNKTKFM